MHERAHRHVNVLMSAVLPEEGSNRKPELAIESMKGSECFNLKFSSWTPRQADWRERVACRGRAAWMHLWDAS
jgi:hypothetical protein